MYFLYLKVFIRKKRNKSGVISVQVIDKSSGVYKVATTIGSTTDLAQLDILVSQARDWINNCTGTQKLDFDQADQQLAAMFEAIKSIQLIGVDLLLGKLFDEIGFNAINDPVFKHLVLYRLVYPTSKLKTTEYLYRYQQIDWSEDKVYRYLDKLHDSHKELVQQISYKHTISVLDGKPQIVFYDVTTIYFEIEQEDDLRRTGFSKEGKHQNPQIVLGLLVSTNGYPLAYDVFKGNQFEGHTMLPVIESFKEKFQLDNLVIVADAGLLSKSNIELMIEKKYEFILGARIKNESYALQQTILKSPYKNGDVKSFDKKDNTRIIITYSDSRATKDSINRERGLKRLEKQIRKGRLTKASINNKGYNKYLKMDGSLQISIDYQKYNDDAKWDGLKGYITNCKLNPNEVIENYHHLWQIEKAFRISKTDLKVRPVYHRLPKRIEAHICLNFVAYKIFKELERQLKIKKASFSPTKAIEIASFIFAITVTLPISKETKIIPLLKTEEQKQLAMLFDLEY